VGRVVPVRAQRRMPVGVSQDIGGRRTGAHTFVRRAAPVGADSLV
jgi:hypothetical protein